MAKDYTLELDESLKGSSCEETLNRLIQITIARIGPEVTWDHFEGYLGSKISDDHEIFDNLHASIYTLFQQSETSETPLENHLHKLSFNDAQTAQAFFTFTQHTFPIIHSEYPKINNNEILLTDDQLFFCRLGAKLHTGDLHSEILADYFLKTLRADQEDYSDKFIKGIIPTSDGTRRLQNLRPKEREAYTIMGDGSVRSRATHAAVEKATDTTFTQNQSCTYLGSDATTPPFGFDKNREAKLYGILTHRKDVRLNRLLINDGGTIARPFDADSEHEATNKAKTLRNQYNEILYSPEEFVTFLSKNSEIRKRQENTNEVLARLRFNLFRNMICVCADSLEARLLAKDFAEEILEAYTQYAKSQGIQLNPKFKIPIIFYIKNRNIGELNKVPRHRIYLYTRLMQNQDRKTATQIYVNKHTRNACIDKGNFEFLLGLDKITAKMLVDSNHSINNMALAMHIMVSGSIRMLLRILRPSRRLSEHDPLEQSALKTTVFHTLVNNRKYHMILNGSILQGLIRAEAFDIATKIMNTTNRKLDVSNAIDCIKEINPRHINYFGLENTLRLAGEKNLWVVVRLCLKEYPNISQETIDYLFVLACNKKDKTSKPDIVFLLKKKKVSITTIKIALSNALKKYDYNLFEIILTNHEDFKNSYKSSLNDIIVDNTPPFSAMGIDKTLRSAADQGHWVTVRFCLNLYSNISPETIDHIFTAACKRKEAENDSDIIFLLKQKKVSAKAIKKALDEALMYSNNYLLEVIINHVEDYFLLLADLTDSQSKAASMILRLGTQAHPRPHLNIQYALTSTLFYGIRFGLHNLLPELLAHESKHPDQYSEARYWLAVDLAQAHSNKTALHHLHRGEDTPIPIAPYNFTLSRCYSIFEAMFANQPEVAQFRLLMGDTTTTARALEAYSDEFESALSHFNKLVSEEEDIYLNAFFGCLLDLSLPGKNISLIRQLQELFNKKYNIVDEKIENIIIALSLSKISESNIDNILTLIHSSKSFILWKREIISITFEATPLKYYKKIDFLLTLLYELVEKDLYSALKEHTEIHYESDTKGMIDKWLHYQLERVARQSNWHLTQLLLSEIKTIDSDTFDSVLSIARKQGLEFEKSTFSRLKNLLHGNLQFFINKKVEESAKNKNWDAVRFYLSECDETHEETLNKVLSSNIDPVLENEIILHWKPKAFIKAINQELWSASREEPPQWNTISSYLSSLEYPENYSEFGFALLVAIRSREIGLARKLFSVVKSHKWRKNDREHLLQSTLLYVVKHRIHEILELSFQHEIIDYNDSAKQRLRLALDLAKLLKNKPAITYLESRVDPNPLLDSTDPLKSVCLLVFEAYFIGEKELAEWRLFHYGRQFGLISANCNNIPAGLTILLNAYGNALPHLPYSLKMEPFRCIENIFLYYGNATPCIIMREKTFSSIKTCSCCVEKQIAFNLLLAEPVGNRPALTEFIKHSNHLDVWLLTLTSKELFKAILESKKVNELELMIALLEMSVLVLKQINLNKKKYLSDYLSTNSISSAVDSLIEFNQSTQLYSGSQFDFFNSKKLKQIPILLEQVKKTHQLIIQPEPDNTPLHDKTIEPDSDSIEPQKTL